MTSNVSKSQKKIVEGDCSCSVDRISSLPEDVIERIMDFMSVKDAARTCVLSSRWRYVWAHHPSVILDWRFWENIIVIYIGTSYRKNYPNIVRQILQHHVGYIRTFVLAIDLWLSPVDSLPHTDIDMWVSSLCMRGLKELTLTNTGRNRYRVPCSVYSSSDLIKLNLDFCIIESGCFSNLQTLILGRVTFDSSVVLTTPLLTVLSLDNCYGILHLEISVPRLKSLRLSENDDLYLKPFLTCAGIDYAFLRYHHNENTYFEGRKIFCLVKLLAAWPRISKLVVNGSLFKFLTAGRVPSELGQLNLRTFSIQYLEVDSEQMPWILCILKNSPLLHKFEILFDGNGLNETPDIDESRSILDLQMDRLHTVYMGEFLATPNELVFVKILLQCAPVLKKMLVEENDGVDAEQRLRILKKLLSLQHAFPKTRIVYGPYLDIMFS